eukprot:5429538-Ditylum_brightwellii.AAC.1
MSAPRSAQFYKNLPKFYQFIRSTLITSKLHDGSGSKHKAGTQQGTDQHPLYNLQADGGIKGDVGSVGAGGYQEGQRPCRV